MYVPKHYGESRRDPCPFCKKQATTVSKEGIPVCIEHKNAVLPEMKCVCGSLLEMKNGKFGAFYNCISCGNQRLSRVFELNDVFDASKTPAKFSGKKEKTEDKKQNLPVKNDSFAVAPEKKNPREIVVRADDPFYCS